MDLNTCINKVFKIITSDVDLMKLLVYEESTAIYKDPVVNPNQYLYKQIFPYRYMEDTQNETMSYLNIVIRNLKSLNRTYDTFDIMFSVVTHNELTQVTDGSRVFSILERLNALFDENAEFGFKLRFNKGDEVPNLKGYHGYWVVYSNVDFK